MPPDVSRSHVLQHAVSRALVLFCAMTAVIVFWFFTRPPDDSVLSVQNHRISEIKVLSHMVNILVPLPYDLPVGKASEVLEKICVRSRQLPDVEACVSKGATEFNDSSVSYLIILSCDPANYLNTRRAVLRVVQEELEAAGIQIPFPQIDVHEK